MLNITRKEWEKQVHAALQMGRGFTKDEKLYHLSKWYESGCDVETIKLAYNYACKEVSNSEGNILDKPSGWHFLDRVLGWINTHGTAALQQTIDKLEE